jgi:hypothetical protein
MKGATMRLGAGIDFGAHPQRHALEISGTDTAAPRGADLRRLAAELAALASPVARLG